MRKLAPEQARAIAECIAAGERHSMVAARFGVSVETVGAIKSGKRWAGALDADLRARMQRDAIGTALDAAGARQIMAALEAGRSGRSIADEFAVSESMVSAIKQGRAWAALDPALPARLTERTRRGKTLAEPEVAAIKHRLLSGVSSRKIAAEFGVSGSTVLAISRGKTWSGVAPRDPDS